MAETRPLVSIIVPFYNIEGCVRYCMDSLLNQTFKDYEIVCVDDGSTDGTGELLDRYSHHPNVVVHHKENGGLSDARNYGLRYARGEYITFVDGDDIVSPAYLEHMVKALWQNPGALIVGSFKNLAEDEVSKGYAEWREEDLECRTMSRAEAICVFLHNETSESAWAKLAPKDAYHKPEFFPVGKVYEDLATYPGLLMQFEQVARVSNEDYGYVLREGTISRANKTRIKQALDYIDALEALRVFSVDDRELAYRRTLAIMRMHPILKAVDDDPEAAYRLRKLGQEEVRRNLVACISDGRIGAANKIRVCAFAVSPALHDVLLSIYTRRLGGRS